MSQPQATYVDRQDASPDLARLGQLVAAGVGAPGAIDFATGSVSHSGNIPGWEGSFPLGATLERWFDKICNYHLAQVSNGPTEALNNLIKRIKRIGFGFRNFDNYRIRALLYAGKPNWRVLGSIVVQ